MFAQLPSPTPTELGAWLVCAAAVMSMVLMGKKLFVRKPPIEAEFVSRADWSSRQAESRIEMDRLWDKLEETKTDIVAAVERNRLNVDEKLTDLTAAIARLDERTAT